MKFVKLWKLYFIATLVLLLYFLSIDLDYYNNYLSWPAASVIAVISLFSIVFYSVSFVIDYLKSSPGLSSRAVILLILFALLVSILTALTFPWSIISDSSKGDSAPANLDLTYPESRVNNFTYQVEQQIFELTNELRVEYGMPVLEWDAQLSSVARAHSFDMVQRNYFSHVNPDGQNPSQRADSAGYPTTRIVSAGTYQEGIGENIGSMPTGNVLGSGQVENTPNGVAQALIDRWFESDDHRRNLLSNQYVRIGVGVAYNGRDYLATQNFI